MQVLIDTNIFARIASPGHLQQPEASSVVRRLRRGGFRACVAPQNVYELWVVLTRPVAANGLGLDPPFALEQLGRMTRFIGRLDDGPPVFREWMRLVRVNSIQGKSAHDARLVAIMNVHKVTHLVTFNRSDFLRYPGLTVWTPPMVP